MYSLIVYRTHIMQPNLTNWISSHLSCLIKSNSQRKRRIASSMSEHTSLAKKMLGSCWSPNLSAFRCRCNRTPPFQLFHSFFLSISLAIPIRESHKCMVKLRGISRPGPLCLEERAQYPASGQPELVVGIRWVPDPCRVLEPPKDRLIVTCFVSPFLLAKKRLIPPFFWRCPTLPLWPMGTMVTHWHMSHPPSLCSHGVARSCDATRAGDQWGKSQEVVGPGRRWKIPVFKYVCVCVYQKISIYLYMSVYIYINIILSNMLN